MKKIVGAAFIFSIFVSCASSQNLNKLLKGINKKDSSVRANNQSINGSLSTDEVAGGLKEALNAGVQKGTQQLSAVNGFFANAAIKILLPPEAQKVENTLRSVGLGKQVDDAILSMNRAAEDATKSAAPIFLNAIKQMTIQDAWAILRDGDTSATHYLRAKTTVSLTSAFSPVIQQSLQKVNATKYWNTLFTTYNQMPFVQKVNPDLTAYVTGKALDGIFYEIGLQEKDIRKNPVARTTDLLKKVFGQ
ncbi:MAG: DUF4197 domain-containing protein [Chitinophagaceae bacterium]